MSLAVLCVEKVFGVGISLLGCNQMSIVIKISQTRYDTNLLYQKKANLTFQ